MIEILVDCYYYKECCGKSAANCKKCKNNKVRNKEINYFEAAEDNPRPDPNPVVTFTGPAEHTAGYRCPMCDSHTNPYAIDRDDPRCKSCGFKLNIG